MYKYVILIPIKQAILLHNYHFFFFQRRLREHPVVGEYLRAYEGVVSFKENQAKIMQDRG